MKSREEVKIIGQSAQKMLNVLRSSGKISFVNPILGSNLIRIENGQTGKVIYPNEDYHYVDERGDYVEFDLDDGTEVKISANPDTNSLIFDFYTEDDVNHEGVRETVMNYIDYNYGKE